MKRLSIILIYLVSSLIEDLLDSLISASTISLTALCFPYNQAKALFASSFRSEMNIEKCYQRLEIRFVSKIIDIM